MQQQQQQPRRILEKSRTVRRRYQRSNKRFEFSASQIQRIEREEEREKKAKQLREREKKKLASKKKRAEKEAKEREERRRLGIPEPNAFKIPASQPLLVNFFGASRKKMDEVSKPTEEITEDYASTQESEVSYEEDLIEDAEYESKQGSLSPAQQEEPNVMQQQEPQQSNHTCDKTDDDFSDLETELGDDWLDDVELEKHTESIKNTQQSLGSATATRNDQPTAPVQGTTNKWAAMTESFEDDTSLMLQALDPTDLEKFETPQQPKVAVHEVNETAAPSPSVSLHAASNVSSGHAHCEKCRVSISIPTNFKNVSPTANLHSSARRSPAGIKSQNQQPAQKQQLRTTVPSNDMKISTAQNTPTAFKKPVVAASMQPRRLHFSPNKSISPSAVVYQTHKAYPQHNFDTEDEFGDLPLSTQDVRDLDSMIGFG